MARLRASNPLYDLTADEIAGRRVRVGSQWLIDFASCNYLGFDLRADIAAAVPGYIEKWGTHPSWSRIIGAPRPVYEIEADLASLLGTPDCLVLPTITLIHLSAIRALAGEGHVFVESRAHQTIHEGCALARAHGAHVRHFQMEHLDRLDRMLGRTHDGPLLVCADGVNSMTGNVPALGELAAVTRAHGALLYVDDAHGFGVIGERRADELSPYGMKGNGVVRHLDESYEGIVLVGGLSKAYSSLLAFVACPTALKNRLKIEAAPYLFSGPSPVASLATAQLGLRVNAREGDQIRADLYRKTARLLERLAALGVETLNRSGFPVVEIPLMNADDVDPLGHFLFDAGILATLAPYPVVPRADVGFRLQVTAANTDEEISRLLAVLDQVAERFPLRPRASSELSGEA